MSGHKTTPWSFQGRKTSTFERNSSGCRHKFAENRDGLYCVYCGETIYSAPTRNLIREGMVNENMEVPILEETPKDSYIKVRIRMTP